MRLPQMKALLFLYGFKGDYNDVEGLIYTPFYNANFPLVTVEMIIECVVLSSKKLPDDEEEAFRRMVHIQGVTEEQMVKYIHEMLDYSKP